MDIPTFNSCVWWWYESDEDLPYLWLAADTLNNLIMGVGCMIIKLYIQRFWHYIYKIGKF